MNLLREAAQQALEALGKWSSGRDMDAVELNDLIATLEAALEQQEPEPVAWTDRELELIDGMIEVQLRHAAQCDGIANRAMAEKQKGWDMERVALLHKIKSNPPRRETEKEPVAFADRISFDQAMKSGRGHDVWPEAGDYEARTGRKLRVLYTTPPRRETEQEQAEPVLVVEKEPGYMSRGHFYEGSKSFIDQTEVWKLPIGTKLYTHPPRRETEQEPGVCGRCGGLVYDPVVQQEQAPVARVLQTVGQYHTGRFVAEVETVRRLRDGESLYTTPPRREWRSLSEGEVASCWAKGFEACKDQTVGDLRMHIARAIEAALKEKNV